jgi:DNA-binding response OmpR family regulator
MDEGTSRVNRVGGVPRLLIAAKHASTLEPLVRTFQDSRIDVDFDLCSSHTSAVKKLSANPYRLIIATAQVAEMEQFLLLKRSQGLEGFVPFVVTASPSEKHSAGRVLAEGAFDLIPAAFDHEETVRTIRLGLWQSKLRALIASKERLVDRCRQHLAEYPGERSDLEAPFNGVLSAFEKTLVSVKQSLLLIDESTVSLSDCATKVEQEARKRAFDRLARLQR